jgi:hypothetical protein
LPAEAALIDPNNTVPENNEDNNSSTETISTFVDNAPNTPPTIADAASTTAFLHVSATSPAYVSGIFNNLTDPARTLGIDFTVGDAQTPAGNLTVSTVSNNPAVIPNGNPADGLVFTGSGATRTLKITPTGVGYSPPAVGGAKVKERPVTLCRSFKFRYGPIGQHAPSGAMLAHHFGSIEDPDDAMCTNATDFTLSSRSSSCPPRGNRGEKSVILHRS